MTTMKERISNLVSSAGFRGFSVMTLAVMTTLSISSGAKADLAKAFCQDKYSDGFERFNCSDLLIGTIETIDAYGDFCADGNTSYEYIIATWHRLLSQKPELKDVPTAISMKQAIASLGLDCKK